RARRVLTLNEKNEVLKQLDSCMSYAAVGRHFGLNELAKDLKHRFSFKCTSDIKSDKPCAMMPSINGKALNIWIEGPKPPHTTLDSNLLGRKL
ncbi:putative CENP-B N-terminal DNA-binding domain-containing protein 21, partial [Homarus americanus]